MIRYEGVTDAAIVAAIDQHDAGWRDRAKARTKGAVAKGHVDDTDAIWSDVKAVFARLQGFKCVYCEKPMPEEDLTMGRGAGEYDVEHFRPKNRVTWWPDDKTVQARSIGYQGLLQQGEADGYVRLAFDPTNYGLSCKTCNSGHKRDAFPIGGSTDRRKRKRETLDEVERPMLMLPLGDAAEDPETILGWVGPLPMPRKKSGHTSLRARVCIDFFALDTRGDLLQLRAWAIVMLWPELEHPGASGSLLSNLQAEHSPMAACARAFVSLHGQDRGRAQAVYDACRDWLQSKDRAVLEALVK